MKSIRLSALVGFAAIIVSTVFLAKANADSGPAFFYSYYLSSGNGDYSHRTVDLDHTYSSSSGTHADSLRGPLYVDFYEWNTASSGWVCVMDGPLYFTTPGGATTLTTLTTFYYDGPCGRTQVSLSYKVNPIDVVRPLAMQTSYAVGGSITSDNDSEAYLDFLCAYGSNWASNAGSYNFEVRATSVNMNYYVDSNYVTYNSSGFFTTYPGLTVNLHCHLK